MKAVFLSIILLIYGYFCDICRGACRKIAGFLIKNEKSLAKEPLIFLSKFTEKNLHNWKRLEKKFICLLASDSTF